MTISNSQPHSPTRAQLGMNSSQCGKEVPKSNTSSPNSPRRFSIGKQGHVGRLNFLQNDNIDDQFVHLFDSHDDIKQILYSIEHQSRQTSADLSQLFERSKSNNSHLNKLLDGISAYSRELSEEGSATKSDAGKILSALENSRELAVGMASQQEKRHEDLVGLLLKGYGSQKKPEQKKETEEENENEEMENMAKRVQKLVEESHKHQLQELISAVEQSHASLKSDLANDIFSRLQQVVVTENGSLRQHISDLQATHHLHELSRKFDALDMSDAVGDEEKFTVSAASRNADLVTENKALEKRISELNEQRAAMEADISSLSSQYTQLRQNYSEINDKYEHKLRLCEHIRSEFASLQKEAQIFEDRIKNFDEINTKKDIKRVQKLRIVSPLSGRRSNSMPFQGTDAASVLPESNNSDEDR